MTFQSVLDSAIELDALGEYLANVHVLYWVAGDRRPLKEGRAEWKQYFEVVTALPGDRAAMLEFVRDDEPEAFLEDAKTLRGLYMERSLIVKVFVVTIVVAASIWILMPTVSYNAKSPGENRTKSTINSLRIAIKQYETTYGILSFTGCNRDKKLSDDEYDVLLRTLEGDDAALSVRKIRFIDTTVNGMLDHWGNRLQVVIDHDYDNVIDGALINGADTLETSLVIWSLGEDGEDCTENDCKENRDNINSWRN